MGEHNAAREECRDRGMRRGAEKGNRCVVGVEEEAVVVEAAVVLISSGKVVKSV